MIVNIEQLETILKFISLEGPAREMVLKSGIIGNGFYVQVRIPSSNPYDGCRKWYVSSYSTPSEVVQTAFKAVMTALEHEVRETFQYKRKSIFAPHFDVDVLAEMEIPHDIRS